MPSSQRRGPRPSGVKAGVGLQGGTVSAGCSSLVDPGRAVTAEAWTHPLGTIPAPETGASSLESDLIRNICRADLSASQDPWPGLVR